MLKKEFHRLLKRQLKKSNLNLADNPALEEFLYSVDQAYKSFDKDIIHKENILEQSSKELFTANKKLRKEIDQSNTKLENLVDNVGGIIFETDLEGHFTFLNNAWEKYSGFSIKESLGRNYRDFLINDNLEGKDLEKLFSLKQDKSKSIFKYSVKDKILWFEVKYKLIRDVDGYATGFIGTLTEVTNLKEIEIKLQKASKAKDQFLSTMSHEIRTPLNAVTGLANILLMEDHMPDQSENLKGLKYSGEHLLGLINDLLDFDKINSGKINIVEKNFRLNYFLDTIGEHYSLVAEKKGIQFRVEKMNELPDIIKGDKLKLTQIIKNLLSNSLKFTKHGNIRLVVTNLGLEENKIALEFKVVDTGIGISKSKQGIIFESFMQANSDTSIKYGGTGLGLSISRKLLEIQNSELIVESTLGEGSSFSFIIKFKISNRLSAFEPLMLQKQPNYEPLNMSVLIAEDNKMNVLILKRFFMKWKIKYTIARNGEEVLKYFSNPDFSVDVILMDLQMPILDGYETTKIIRNFSDVEKSKTPIIALTAFAQTDIKEKTLEHKMNGFMGKPFNPEKLHALLKSFC
ncbi:PAS domain-containing hybrid sensor histidine kinase/response regulator [Lacinutrix jangbogonensis]|uniref:PAS domain-containing hybrid sensor histidine kinase/response regulator n=1 Tax=Lacinutrix jangbogonensis TaxID=1469557 RepID=UPI00068BD88E|nr:PAS domain-containing hybrid sensor histidine kinase/response regulator [Lacinutrix jangbogonensis]